MEKVDDFWDFRSELRENLHHLRMVVNERIVQYEDIHALVRNIVESVPTPLAILRPGMRLYRARAIKGPNIFTCKRELSYHPRPAAILDFGRANTPRQAVFYAAGDAGTALYETVEEAFPTDARAEGVLGLGVWQVRHDIPIGLAAFSEAARRRRASCRTAMDSLVRLLERDFSDEGKMLVVEALTFFAERFAKRVKDPLEYMTTAAYFNCILCPKPADMSLRTPDLVGFCYPSVKAELAGDNIALLPEVVDSSLALVDVTEVRFTKDGGDVCVDVW